MVNPEPPHDNRQDPSFFLQEGLRVAGYGPRPMSMRTQMRRFREMYGCDPVVVQVVWYDLEPNLPPKTKLEHLFWSLFFLRKYPTDGDMATRYHKDPSTVRKWVWTIIFALSDLKADKIKFPESDSWVLTFIVSVDGTDCPIEEPRPFDKAWFSQKFKGPGVKYEVALDVLTGCCVWINGPFKASKSDITIYREGLRQLIPEGRFAVGDLGYRGEPANMTYPNALDPEDVAELKRRISARQETFFSRMKSFKVLKVPFRHKPVMQRHKRCFEAVAVLVQYSIDNGSPLFHI